MLEKERGAEHTYVSWGIIAVLLLPLVVLVFATIYYFFKAEANFQAVIVSAFTTLLVVILNAHYARHQAAYEVYKQKKAESYERFVKALIGLFDAGSDHMHGQVGNKNRATEGRLVKKQVGGRQEKGSQDQEALKRLVLEVASNVVLYGDPKLVKAFNAWREVLKDYSSNSEPVRVDDKQQLMIFRKTGELILAMREDLGQSVAGLEPLDMFALYVLGGKRAIKEHLQEEKD